MGIQTDGFRLAKRVIDLGYGMTFSEALPMERETSKEHARKLRNRSKPW